MPTGPKLVGMVLVAAAFVDVAVGLFVVLPRIRDERARAIVRSAITFGAALIFGIGVGFLTGVLGTPDVPSP